MNETNPNPAFTSVLTSCGKELTPAEFDAFVLDRAAKADANVAAAKALGAVFSKHAISIDPTTAQALVEAVGDAILEARRAGFREAVGSSAGV